VLHDRTTPTRCSKGGRRTRPSPSVGAIRDNRGNQIPQTSAPEVIARLLELLDVQPGNRVLEIGTGSGYSSALLAELTGTKDNVFSIDVDPTMTERAATAQERRT